MSAARVLVHDGAELLVDGELRRVVAPVFSDTSEGRVVHLARPDGEIVTTLLRSLGATTRVESAGVPGNLVLANKMRAQDEAPRVTLYDHLTDDEKAALHRKLGHVLEAETGYQSGDPDVALPREPRADFDPARVGLTQRRRNKALELVGWPRRWDATRPG